MTSGLLHGVLQFYFALPFAVVHISVFNGLLNYMANTKQTGRQIHKVNHFTTMLRDLKTSFIFQAVAVQWNLIFKSLFYVRSVEK